MNKIKRKSSYLAMLLLLSLVLLLCGCEKQNDSMKEDLASLNASDGSGDAAEEKSNQLKEQLHIPEELQIDALSDNGKKGYQVNCKVDVPINTSPSVYQQKQVSFSKEEIIKKAEKLFDSGKFSYVKPLDCYTLDELNEELTQIQNKWENEHEKWEDYDWQRRGDLAYCIELFKESRVKEFKEGEFIEGSEMAFYDKIMIMEGEIGGEVYHLLAFTSEGHNYLRLCKRSHGYSLTDGENYFGYQFKLHDFEHELSEGSTGTSSVSVSGGGDEDIHIFRSLVDEKAPTQAVKRQHGENICSYSEEEAGKLALQYAALLGDTDMAIIKTNWYFDHASVSYVFASDDETSDETDETKPNGYAFYLQRQYGNLSCNESNFWWREATDTDKERAAKADPSGIVAEQENYRVEVTNEGVVSIDTIEPWYEVTRTLSDSTSLMDFTDVQELAQGYFEELAKDKEADESEERDITRIGEVALRYATVLYDGEYTLIPCWFFNESGGNWGGTETVMVINAIDGSKVFSRRMY